MKLPSTIFVVNEIDGTGQQITTVALFYKQESAKRRAGEMNSQVNGEIEDEDVEDLPQGYVAEEMEIS